MSPTLMASENGHVAFIWSIAERLRGSFKQHEYGSIILPLTLLRRLDQVLAPTREKVLEEAAKYEGRGLDLDPILKRASGQLFYNSSKLTLEKVLADPDNVASHLEEYVSRFDPVVAEIFEAFDFSATVRRLEKADRLYSVLGKFLDPELDLHPDTVPHDVMGDIFEELIRRFSEISNETAGEHFTPREVVRLCAELVLAGDEELLSKPGIVRTVYDPACGTGGMLSVVDELVRERNSKARLVPFGQELNPESWAICRAEMLVKGQDPSRITPGSTLSADGAEGQHFDYMLANPPFGVDWADDHDVVLKEHSDKGFEGRFGAGTPRKSDGSLLFLQNMLSKMKPADQDGGSRIAIIFNASPLFSGDAGSGESEIRRWLLQPDNDWLESIVALPEQLFYNTGIATYLWVLTDRKEKRRKGKVQLIDARNLWEAMPKSLGNKRRRLSPSHIEQVLDTWKEFATDSPESKVLPNESFGYKRVVVERPLRLHYRGGEPAVSKLDEQVAFHSLTSPPKGALDPIATQEAGDATQEVLVAGLREISLETTDREEMETALEPVFESAGELSLAVRKAVWEAVSVRAVDAPIISDGRGNPKADAYLRDAEQVPLTETVADYIEREVLPFVPDAWVDESKTRVGYEIPFNRLFYRDQPTRPLETIDSDIERLELDIQDLLRKVTRDDV